MNSNFRRRASALAAAVAAVTLLAGCSLQSLGMGTTPTSPTHPSPSASSTAHRQSAVDQTSARTTHYVRGSLAAGTVTHKLAAGNRQLVVTYWTTQDVGTWTAGKPVAVNVSAHLENSRRSVRVLVTTFAATFTTGDGAASTLRRDRGRFIVTPPFSYVSAVVIPAVPPTTRTARADIEFDLLVETAPNSHAYARQTVLDSLNFTYRTDPTRNGS